MKRIAAFVGMCGALAACADTEPNTLAPLGETLVKSAFQSAPFAVAPIDIVFPAGHELQTLALRPCGATICGSRAGTVQNSAAGTVITGAYRGVTITLAPGGAGTISRGATQGPIVWDFVD